MQGVLVVLNACCRHKSNETVEEFKYKLKKQEPGDPEKKTTKNTKKPTTKNTPKKNPAPPPQNNKKLVG